MPVLSVAFVIALAASGQIETKAKPASKARPAAASSTCQSSARFRPHKEQEALRALFDSRQFGQLEKRLAELRIFGRDKYCSDRPLMLGFEALIDSAPSEGKAYSAWIETFPKSAFAYTARGMHWDARADIARGDGYISKTSAAQIDVMHRLNATAATDFRKALALDPTLSLPAMGLIRQARHTGGVLTAIQKFSPMFPGSYAVHSIAISALTPRWGGSPEQMLRVANVTAANLRSYPDLAMLKPYAMCNIAVELSVVGDLTQADQILRQVFGALQAPADPSCWSLRARVERTEKRYADASDSLVAYHEAIGYVRRTDLSGDTLLRQKRYSQALDMFDRGIRFDHGQPDLYCGRADVRRGLGRLSEARVDVQHGLAIDPGEEYCSKALARIVAKESAAK